MVTMRYPSRATKMNWRCRHEGGGRSLLISDTQNTLLRLPHYLNLMHLKLSLLWGKGGSPQMLPWRSKGNFEESVFSFPWVGPGDETPVNRLDINFFFTH